MRMLSFSNRRLFGVLKPYHIFLTDLEPINLDGEISEKLGKKCLSRLSS